MSDIPLIDLRAQYQALKPEIDRAIQAVLDRGQFILGPEVGALEREVAAYCGTAHAVAVASGTDALELSLRALGIGPGDEVLTTAYSFVATAEAIVAVGAAPVFVDIDPVTYNLDPNALASKVTSKTKAIVPVHLFGHPCDLEAVNRVAREHGLKIVEDCAQAMGAQYHNRRVGSFGDVGCLSFFPSKNQGAYGDGGMVVTNDAALAEQVRLRRTHGSYDIAQFAILGKNSRLDELQAAILRVKLPYLDRWNDARRQHARRYSELFLRHRLNGLVLPQEQPGCTHTYHLYTIRIPERDRVKQALAEQGIATQAYYSTTLPVQPALAPFTAHPAGQFPQAEEAARDVLSIPMYPELNPAAIERVVRMLIQTLKSALKPSGKTA